MAIILSGTNYIRHLTNALINHRKNEDFVDVILCCDGHEIKAHKVILSSGSAFFKEIFKGTTSQQNEVIVLDSVKFADLNLVVEYMYQGEVAVRTEAVQSFLQTAVLLGVEGLTATRKEETMPPHYGTNGAVTVRRYKPNTVDGNSSAIQTLQLVQGKAQTDDQIEENKQLLDSIPRPIYMPFNDTASEYGC